MNGVVINADDFGKDQTTTNAIFCAFEQGLISQTTLMVNMPDADRAVMLAKERGLVDRVGLHLNLVEGMPLTEGLRSCRLFCNEHGRFFEGGVLRLRRLLQPYSAKIASLIREECQAQIDKYLAYGLPLMHCDSHCHAHVRLPITRILFPILKTAGFKTVRRTYGVSRVLTVGGMLHLLRNATYVAMMRRYGFRTTERFNGFTLQGLSGKKSIEMMVHPGFSNGELIDISDYKHGTGAPLERIADGLRASGVCCKTIKEVAI